MSRRFLLAFLAGTLLLTACARPAYRRVSLTAPVAATAPPTTPAGPPALRVAVAAILSPQSTLHLYDRLAGHLADRLERPVELVQRATYAETNELIRTGQVARAAGAVRG